MSRESDYKKWLVFSRSAASLEQANHLFQALDQKKSLNQIRFLEYDGDEGTEYVISEDGNPTELSIGEPGRSSLLEYLEEHYLVNHSLDEKASIENNENNLVEPKQKTESNTNSLGREQSRGPWLTNLTSRITRSNKWAHGFNFSLVVLLSLQLIILPINFTNLYEDINRTFLMTIFYLLMGVVAFFTVKAYYRHVEGEVDFGKIIKVILPFYFFLFSWLAVEVSIFALFEQDDVPILALLFFFVLFLWGGAIVGLINAAILLLFRKFISNRPR
ncbi:MAG: hypothetical protein AAFX87_04585 [Bacteroidota bacterium]